jgi:phosphoglycerate dehydrogenase-like enzyme
MSQQPARDIHAVLSTLYFAPEEIEQLRQAFAPAEFIQLNAGDVDGIANALQRVDVAVLPFDLDQRFLDAPHLKWVHCDHAGLERSARPEAFAKGLLISGSAGRSAEALAQHAFYFALALTFDARGLFDSQSRHQWGGIPGYEHRRALFGKTMGIVGFGHTGQAVAALAKAFGMSVIAYRREAGTDHPHVDTMLSAAAGDSLDAMLQRADVIVLAAGLNDATYRMFSTDQFRAMKPTAYLINMARGGLIDHDALEAALIDGAIAGAGLDCTDPEPLPPTSRLWGMPNVILTPHMTPQLPDRTQRSIAVIIENIRRYRSGEPLLNLITAADRFSRAR